MRVEDSRIISVVSPQTLNKIISKAAQIINLVCNGILKNSFYNWKHDDFIIGDKRYKGIQGLYGLLTYTDKPSQIYVNKMTKNYSRILTDTTSIYKNNDLSIRKSRNSIKKLKNESEFEHLA